MKNNSGNAPGKLIFALAILFILLKVFSAKDRVDALEEKDYTPDWVDRSKTYYTYDWENSRAIYIEDTSRLTINPYGRGWVDKSKLPQLDKEAKESAKNRKKTKPNSNTMPETVEEAAELAITDFVGPISPAAEFARENPGHQWAVLEEGDPELDRRRAESDEGWGFWNG